MKFSPTGKYLLLANYSEIGIVDVEHGILSQRMHVPFPDRNYLARPSFSSREHLLMVPITGEDTEFCQLVILDIASGNWLGRINHERLYINDEYNVGVTVTDDDVLRTSTGLSWNLKEPLATLQRLKKLTLKQHQILNGIYRVCIAARVQAVKKLASLCDFMTQSGYACERDGGIDNDHAYQKALMNDVDSRLSEVNFGFDFNRYPIETQLAYDALPPEIRSLFDPYVIRHKEANNSMSC